MNYLNTKPLLYGLEHQPVSRKIELIGQYPSQLVNSLREGRIDLGLLPVAAIPGLPRHHLVGHYGIASDGEIASVALFSDVPLEQIKKIYLDYQSRTSVELLKYLMRESWHISPELIPAEDEGFREKIKDDVAGLVIGDRAFEQRKISALHFDLSMEWKKLTGLPFVFAAWISMDPLPEDFTREFDAANAWGVKHIDDVIRSTPYELYNLSIYYKKNIQYRLDDAKIRALQEFLKQISS